MNDTTKALGKTVSLELIEQLKSVDTPTVCNVLEELAPKRRGYGYTTGWTIISAPAFCLGVRSSCCIFLQLAVSYPLGFYPY